jgi:hypothetical protein
MVLCKTIKGMSGLLAAGLFCAAVPLHAETFEELDALSAATDSEESGIALAQQQAARSEYLEALATLERVLTLFPRSQSALLMHALYLCEVDDRQGGMVELSKLRPRDLARRRRDGEAMLENARSRCQSSGQNIGLNEGAR